MESGIYKCSRRNHKFEVHSGLLIPESAIFFFRTGRYKKCWDKYRLNTSVHKVKK